MRLKFIKKTPIEVCEDLNVVEESKLNGSFIMYIDIDIKKLGDKETIVDVFKTVVDVLNDQYLQGIDMDWRHPTIYGEPITLRTLEEYCVLQMSSDQPNTGVIRYNINANVFIKQ